MELPDGPIATRHRSSFVWSVLPLLAALVCPPLVYLSDAPGLTLACALVVAVVMGWTSWQASRQTITVTDQRIEVVTSPRYVDRVSSPVTFPIEGVQVRRRLAIRWLFTDIVRWTLSQEGVPGTVKVNVFWLRRSARRQLSELLLARAAEDDGRPVAGRTILKTSCGPVPREPGR